MKMKPNSHVNLRTFSIELLEDFACQKCILPKAVFNTYGLRPGVWAKCVLNGKYDCFAVCQVYPRDIEPKCCYLDNCVGTDVNAELAECFLHSVKPIQCQTRPVGNVDIILEMTERFFSTRLRQLPPNVLATTAKQVLAALQLLVGCSVRTADMESLGIAAIHIDACVDADVGSLFQLDDNTTVHIKDFHVGAHLKIKDSTPFYLYGFETGWKQLEDLLTAARLQNMKSHGILPHLNALLIGPTGCGKTSLLNAFVAAHNFNCFHITMDSVLQQYPGETERELRKVFKNALHLHTELKAEDPTIIIVEDLELLCPAVKYTSTDDGGDSNRICAQLVKLLDEFHQSSAGVVCIATTSSVESINKSARRPGRFQHEIVIDWPNECVRKQLFKAMFEYSQSKPYLKQQPLKPRILNLVAKRTQGFVAGDLALLVENVVQSQLKQKDSFDIGDLIKTALVTVKPASLHAAEVAVYKVAQGFEFIGGMDKLKRCLEVSVLTGLRKYTLFKHFGLKLPKGVLLYGPPGCGKTTVAKCLAKEADMAFITTSGAEVYSPFVGCAEKFMSNIFDTARKNAPCLIFLDEIDTLAGRRPINGGSTCDVSSRILSTLLTEMDGIVDGSEQIIVVAASNRPEMIDDALLRPGRFSKHIFVPAPDFESRLSILELHAKRMPFSTDVNILKIAKVTTNYSGADICNLCNEAAMLAFQRIGSRSNVEWKIIGKDFAAALKITKSSLSATQINKYLEFQKKMSVNS